MMKKLFTFVLLLFGAMQGVFAQEPYAVLSDDNTTLTFHYDNNKESRSGMSVGPFTREYNQTTYKFEVNTEWYSQRDNITTVVFDKSFADYADLSSTACWFYGCSNLSTINGFDNLNTSNVIDMSYMFCSCSGLTNLDVSNFNTANVTSMTDMFGSCSGLINLNLSNFNTANVTSMAGMFAGCSGLTNLNVSNFNTAQVTDMSSMFQNCSGLTSLDVSNFNTENVTDMSQMFLDCTSLTSLDVSHLNTKNVNKMRFMFGFCSSLMSLDVNNFNIGNVTDMTCLFAECSGLTTIYNNNTWSCDISNYMFNGCISLAGAISYNGTKTDVTYANPTTGYFTAEGTSDIPKPYAVLSENNTNLTFYYDNNKASRSGMDVGPFMCEYDWKTYEYVVNSEWFSQRKNITTVVFDKSFANYTDLSSTAYWFYECSNLTTINGIENLSTSNVTDMSNMFNGCSNLTNLDLGNFNTTNVSNMNAMFWGCSGLTSLDLGNFNTANVSNMTAMFRDCSGLTSLDLRNFNTGNVISMWLMFWGCFGLTSLDLSNFNTANVTDMSCMFNGCSGLTSLDVSNFNTAKVTDMPIMFEGCSGLTSLDLSNFNTANVTDMSCMFNGCSGLTSLDLSDFNTENVTNMSAMFSGCSSLTSLDLSNFNTAQVTDMSSMFQNCSGLTTIYYNDTWNCSSSYQMFSNCTSLKGAISYNSEKVDVTYANPTTGYFTAKSTSDNPEPYAVLSADNTTLTFYYDGNRASHNGMGVGPFDRNYDYSTYTSTVNSGWYNQRGSITSVVFDKTFADYNDLRSTEYWFYECSNLTIVNGIENLNTNNVTDMSDMFYGCSNLKSLDLSNFNTEKVTGMDRMFYNCRGLTSLDLSNFDTENVRYMKGMFNACTSLTSLDVSNFNTKNVTDMNGMFYFCSSLTSLDVSKFNTENVTNMGAMFLGCSGLTSLDLSNFNTENVTTMYNMFTQCYSLTSLDVSNFNTGNVKEMQQMFTNCVGLTSLDLSNFDTENVTDMREMFAGCSGLTSIYCNDAWGCESSNDMFYGCTSLVGAISYDETKTDVTYANPTTGYFTYKVLTPMDDEEVSFGEDGNLNENTDLGGTVVDNVYFNINPENGGYDAEEKCVVVSKPMTDEEIETVFGKDLLSDDVKNTFAGMVIEVPAGKGKVTVEAQTTGGMTLKVKIGSADPIEMELEGKLKMKFPYNVTEPTYVYIYAGEVSASGSRNFGSRGNENPSLKIYGISVSTDTYLKGDANGDGVISDADVIAVKDYIMGNEPENFVFEGADANEDGKVNAADIVEIVNKKK